jgi:hypothetical protein
MGSHMAASKTAPKKEQVQHLVGLEPIAEIIHVALLTSFIENSIPIAVMLIGPSGGGKTQTLKRFEGSFIHRTNDLTTSGLWSLLKEDKENKLSHICLEDFNPLLSHKTSVSNLTIASLLSVMGDGMLRVDDGREVKTLLHRPVGIITGVTPEMFQAHLEKWQGLGFVRRFLPVHFTYTQETISQAQKAVKKGDVSANPLPPIKLTPPKAPVNPIFPESASTDIESLSVYLGQHLGVNVVVTKDNGNQWKRNYVPGKAVLPMAPHIILRTMAQARALKEGRMKVDDSDIKFLRRLVDFANPMQPTLI